jgi:hypothetical protein
MTHISELNLDGVNCKNALTRGLLTKRLNAVNVLNLTFAKPVLDSLLDGVDIDDNIELIILGNDSNGASFYDSQFQGMITSANPRGRTIEIEAKASGKALPERIYDGGMWGTVDAVVEALTEYTAGLTFTNLAYPTETGLSITKMYGLNQDCLTLLNRCCDMSVNPPSPRWVFFQDGRSMNYLNWDRFGRESSGIILSNKTNVCGNPIWRESTNEMCNEVTIFFSGGVLRDSNNTSISIYGTHARTYHINAIDNKNDAQLVADMILYDYAYPRELITLKAKHEKLVPDQNNPEILNKTYYITDLAVNKSSGPYAVLEEKMILPFCVSDFTLGNIYQDMVHYEKTLDRRIQELERSRPSLYASNTVRATHAAYVATSSTTYAKLKTVTLTNGLPIIYRVAVDMRSATGTTVWIAVYRNGVATGFEASSSSTGWAEKQWDIAITLLAGDTLEIWGKAPLGGTCEVQDFELRYDHATIRDAVYTTS